MLAAAVTAAGMGWLLETHPSIGKGEVQEHWLLPTLTAFIIGVLLDNLPAQGTVWWAGLAVGGFLLVAVFLAEYVAVDPGAPTYALAAAGLIALSYTLFLLFVIALQLASVRLFLSVPAIVVAAGLVTLRTLHLRLGGKWDFSWSVGVSIVTAQLAAGLHYWPLSPLQSGLILLGPLYGLTALAYSLSQDIPFRSAFAEPAIILGGLWAAAVFLR